MFLSRKKNRKQFFSLFLNFYFNLEHAFNFCYPCWARSKVLWNERKKGKEINKNTLNTLKKVQGEDDYDYMPNTTLTKPSDPEQYHPANNLRVWRIIFLRR